MRKVYFQKWQSPVGDLFLFSTEAKLLALLFDTETKMFSDMEVVEASTKILQETISQLSEYFAGQRKSFEIPIEFIGTDFQKRAWQALTEIPFGQTVTYGEQAKKLNAVKAVRAVGAANGRNPIAIIVPCHRVIGANGKLTGYAGGLEMKSKLLAIEGIK